MKISYNKPPHYWLLVKLFGFDWSRNVAVFGDTLYSKNHDLPDHLIIHEKTHTKQQKHSKIYAVWWWAKYILSPEFRFSQELEAYQAQWKYFQTFYHSSAHFSFLHKITSDLASPLYGSIVSYSKAMRLIRENEKTHQNKKK